MTGAAHIRRLRCWLSRSASEAEEMRHYAHLTAEERGRIAEVRARRESAAEIARALGGDRSTVGRELARSGRRGRYGACPAQRRADGRHARRRPAGRLDDPALAGGGLRLGRGACVVSLSTIYRAVARGDLGLPGREPVRRRLGRCVLSTSFERKSHRFLSSIRSGSARPF